MKRFHLKDLLLLIPIGILLIVQLPNLSLPYFWDEAWSYVTAINAMADAGPSLLPGVVPIDYCKGHPQFFFFVTSLWMNLFPNSISMMRILPMLFSIGLIVATYFGLKKIANWQAGIFASVLISVQSMFLAQSIFLLPEMLVTLMFVLSYFFFLDRKFLAYTITSTLMVFTKETSIVFAITFGLFYLISLLNQSEREKFKITHLLALIAPGLIYIIFLLLHYMAFKVVFYGEHLGHIATDWNTVLDKTNHAMSMLFVRYGRSSISVFALLSLVFLFFRKDISKKPVLLAILSFLTYITFSVYNFYTQRYGLVVLVLFIILFAYIWGQIKFNLYIKSGVILILAVVCLGKTLTNKSCSDTDLGYVETIKVHQEIVRYCEQNQLQDEPLAVSFNMIFNLNDKDLGYVTGTKDFSDVKSWKFYLDAKYFIYESTFNQDDPSVQYAKNNYKLIKSFSNNHASGYIFENLAYHKNNEENK